MTLFPPDLTNNNDFYFYFDLCFYVDKNNNHLKLLPHFYNSVTLFLRVNKVSLNTKYSYYRKTLESIERILKKIIGISDWVDVFVKYIVKFE